MTEAKDTWTDLLTRWDRQQNLYVEQRERRFGIMLDLLGELPRDRTHGARPPLRPLTSRSSLCGSRTPSTTMRRSFSAFMSTRWVALTVVRDSGPPFLLPRVSRVLYRSWMIRLVSS